ncbi:undecaprenyldiphospho-muramoylpentapeptide beta-N-acetylglucosaminyltransferase [Fusobacterium sp.]|uniref:undecaprenyldiphospho-muramoylpentapeptide beta-N-acetylglucosaminyltransferase n=1 Tax=Fusobacterium sp. TaxID=68766 RepID=UPI00262AAAAB|nr:undecaprenyldiphospho-muramoylpentapeptide beta-N-acetylglucosaminyltransferase [Fusobacterium sp.]
MKKVIITTGGTGGHIYPALSVAKGLIRRDIDVLFVGSDNRMEKDMVPKEKIRFIGLNIYPIKSIKMFFKLISAVKQSIKIIKEEKPDAVIGFGNYISLPMVTAAFLTRTNFYLQEQNANLGMTNKFYYKFAKKTFLAFEKTYDDIPIKYQHKFKVTGNPLREEIYNISNKEEREKLKVENGEKIILITGGSLGAKSINDAVLNEWEKLKEKKNIRIYWATGKAHYEKISKKIEKRNMKDIIKPYFNNLINIMSAADLVICRAGALTISELIELKKPSILIPYNSIKVGQYENAIILEEREGALVFNNDEAEEAVRSALDLIEDDEQLQKMKLRIKALRNLNATESLINSLDIWRN